MKIESEVGWVAEERNKFEQHKSVARTEDGTPIPPGNPYVYREWPRMLFRAKRTDSGLMACIDPHNEQWSRGNCAIANNEHDFDQLYSQGWRKTQQEAIQRAHGFEKDMSDAHAMREYSDRNMSDGAKAEAAKVVEATGLHVGEIPEQPRVKRKYTRRKPAITES